MLLALRLNAPPKLGEWGPRVLRPAPPIGFVVSVALSPLASLLAPAHGELPGVASAAELGAVPWGDAISHAVKLFQGAHD
eukprot:2925134-Pyramimonas_sp.AAC.1